jgi:hypothetical protein
MVLLWQAQAQGKGTLSAFARTDAEPYRLCLPQTKPPAVKAHGTGMNHARHSRCNHRPPGNKAR